MAQILKKQYVREDVIMETPTQRLMSIKQQFYNNRTKRLDYKSISQIVTQFETILQEIGNDVPADIPNLAQTFVHSLSQQLQQKLLKIMQRYQAPADHRANVQNFNNIVKEAYEVKVEQKEFIRLARSAKTE